MTDRISEQFDAEIANTEAAIAFWEGQPDLGIEGFDRSVHLSGLRDTLASLERGLALYNEKGHG